MNPDTLAHANALARRIAWLEARAARVGACREAIGQRGVPHHAIRLSITDPQNHANDVRVVAEEDAEEASEVNVPAAILERAVGEIHDHLVDKLLAARRELERL